MGLEEIEALLKTSMGLSAASIGSTAIDRAVRDRMLACRLDQPQAYLERLRASAAELQALIEVVVVAETWFFRDRHAYTALARLAREEWLPAHPTGAMSLLSLPCSTGEEPYSMAMALIEAGVPPPRFRVDAIDISERSLALAARAVYGSNSFRGQDLDFRERHFELTPNGYRLSAPIRQQVRFAHGNLFAADLLPGAPVYDAIFCRNVLIYFDRPTQSRALGVLNRLLRPQGVLFVAPAETGLPAGHQLVSTRQPLAFAFRKAGGSPPAESIKSVPTPRPVAPARAGRMPAIVGTAAVIPSAAAPLTIVGHDTIGSEPSSHDLTAAMRLADQGHFVEAAACCDTHIRHHGPSAQAFYLLGLMRDAMGNHDEAAASYRKALYLDPDHYDTQIHLALLLEMRGERAAAETLRNRARRVDERRKVPRA